MATEKELKTILAPVLARYPDWRYSRHLLFRAQIGLYLRGVALCGTWSSREDFLVKRFVFPLFEWSEGHHISWGQSRPIPGTPSHNWNVFHPGFADKLIELIETEVSTAVAEISTGADFLRYLTDNYTEHGWQDWGKALAFIHMGDLKKAREFLIPTAKTLRSPDFKRLVEPDAWGHNVLELLRLIDEDPAAVPAHCEAVARRSVKTNKLEKFWQPTPFVYETAPFS